MDIHQNAVVTPKGRETMVYRVLTLDWSYRAVARAHGVDPKTVRRWVKRYESEGLPGLCDRSSRPRRQPRRTSDAVEASVIEWRHRRWPMIRIAERVGISRATVSRILRRHGLNRVSMLERPEPPRRYEHESPGDLLHLDIKRLGRFERPGHRVTGDPQQASRGAGWEYVHVAIDDHSRVSFARIYPNEGKHSAIAHLQAAVQYYASLGVSIRRVLTDNGSCYRSHSFAKECRRLGLRHQFTRPYRPQTNGKAERFIQTALREWAYAYCYSSSNERSEHLPRWLHDYNWHRRHGSLNGKTPISTLGLTGDNLLRLHT